jgi:putative transposase
MSAKRYTEEQIVAILKESAAGAKTTELLRKYNLNPNTFYKWRQRYAGMDVPDVKKLRMLQEENMRLKKKLAETILDLDTAKELLSKNF